MAGIVDTNILLYAANKDADEATGARSFLSQAAGSADQWYLTEGILYEFLRVATHARVFDHPLSWREALDFLSPFLASPRFQIVYGEEGHWHLLQLVLDNLNHPAGNLFFDVRTVTLMREHGIREIYTTDSDFLQFPDIRVHNPLRLSEP